MCGCRAQLQCHPLLQGVSKPSPFSPCPSCPTHFYPVPAPLQPLQRAPWVPVLSPRAADQGWPDCGPGPPVLGPPLSGEKLDCQRGGHHQAECKAWWDVWDPRSGRQPGVVHHSPCGRWVTVCVWVSRSFPLYMMQRYLSWTPRSLTLSPFLFLSPDKTARWRAVLKSISVPFGMFVTLAGFILFMKRYTNCSLTMIINGLRGHHTTASNHQRVNVQVRGCSEWAWRM